ncbi:hypothetical protein ACFL08_01475 [Patescibacteria group bacterium]
MNFIFNSNRRVFLAYFILAGILFVNVCLSGGFIIGGDWSMPGTAIQTLVYFEDWNDTWTNIGNFFGLRQIALTSVLFKFFNVALFKIGLVGKAFQVSLIVTLLSCAAYFLFDLLVFIGIKRVAAFFAGIIYVTSPLFFDYVIMGWQFVLIVLLFFPLVVKYFIKAVNERKLSYAVMVGIFYSVSMTQSQSIIWFPMLLFILSIYLIRDKTSFISYVKAMLVVFAIFLCLNAYWLPGMVLVPDKGVSGSDIVNSSISLGTMGNFFPINIIRLFGGLFNFQYETEMQKTWLYVFSFVMPILALGSLFVRKYKREVLVFWIIGLVPFLMYLLNFHRDILLHIPFANVIRDFARFTVFSTFAYAVLIGIFLSYLFAHKRIIVRRVGMGCVILWLVAAFPWWTGALTDWEGGVGSDMRLRTKVFSDGYYDVETNFYDKKLDQKASFFPYNGVNDLEDDQRFHGAYKEIQDLFAGYSSIPGVIAVSDRGQGYLGDFLSLIDGKEINIFELSKLSNIKYTVLRENMFMKNRYEFLGEANEKIDSDELGVYFEKENMIVFEKKDFLPHFYTPVKNIVSEGEIEELMGIISEDEYEARSAVFFKNQNREKLSELDSLSERNDGDQIIEFRKINPTKYRLRIHNVTDDFPLIFSESFHEKWNAYIVRDEVDSEQESGSEDKGILKQVQDDKVEIQSDKLGEYKVLDGNEDDQASIGELEGFIEKGWVTDLGDGKEKESKHYKWNGEKEVIDYVERYGIDFVSKNFNGTIQNDNLPTGSIRETWMNNSGVLQLSDKKHLLANGYANSWVIDVDDLCGEAGMCQENEDGSYDMEFVVEFWPQRVFYIGLFISGLTLLGCLGYLGYDYRKKKILGNNKIEK